MKKQGFIFLGILFVVLLGAFLIHLGILFWLDLELFDNLIILSYILNYALAALLLIAVKSNLNKQSSHTGFLFMAGSGLKFLIFFLFFYPVYQSDDTMQTVEFAAFFVPYALCLTLEVVYLAKLLNNQTYSEEIQRKKKK